ncbi:MAG: hypothetical protein R8K47_04220, partial [Mariprofundaceae bacterium]
WWKRAAEGGDPLAMFNLGNLYRKGEGVPQDDVRAARWYRRAARLGLPQAMNAWAYMLAVGRGVAADTAAAREWFAKAKAAGLRMAEGNLTVLSKSGQGYALASLAVDTSVRATLLTQEPLDLEQAFEMHRSPLL